MNIFLDSDVLFDLFARRQPFYESIGKLATMQAVGDCKLWSSINSYVEVSRVLSREVDTDTMMRALSRSLKMINVVTTGEEQMAAALAMNWTSLANAMTIQCARHCKADYILSRSGERLEAGGIPIMTPERFFSMLETEHGVSYESVDLHTPLGRHGAPRTRESNQRKRGRHSS